MTKKTSIVLLLLIFLLAACSSGGNQTNNTNTNNDQNSSNGQTDLNNGNETIEDPVYSPAASAAVCTAVTQPSEIVLEPNEAGLVDPQRLEEALQKYKDRKSL